MEVFSYPELKTRMVCRSVNLTEMVCRLPKAAAAELGGQSVRESVEPRRV